MNIGKEHYSLDEGRSLFLKNKLEVGINKIPEFLDLSKKLEFLEENTILLPGLWESRPEIKRLLERGEEFGCTERFDLGGVSQCHNNVIDKYLSDSEYDIVTGYALSEDGLWRSHSWLMKNSEVYETTESRLKYFGVVLRDTERGVIDSELNEIEDFIKN